MWRRRHGVPVPTDFGAALLIDMQPEFVRLLEEQTRMRLVTAQAMVIRHCARHDIPLVVIELARRGITIDELYGDINHVPRLARITKTGNSGFFGTGLQVTLKKLNVESLLLMGVNASACVMLTATGAISRGYTVITAPDLIADEQSILPYEAAVTDTWYRKNCIYAPGALSLVEHF